jgi:hypothetical protein
MLCFYIKCLFLYNKCLQKHIFVFYCNLIYFCCQFWCFYGVKFVSRNGTPIYNIAPMENKGST